MKHSAIVSDSAPNPKRSIRGTRAAILSSEKRGAGTNRGRNARAVLGPAKDHRKARAFGEAFGAPAADLLDELAQKAIARSEPPTGLLDKLMREQLRQLLEHRARMALQRSGIFRLTSLATYDFDYPQVD